MILKYFIIIALIAISLFAKSNFGAIATGSNTGTYIQLGKDISNLLRNYNSYLEVIPTKGSIENLDALAGKNDKLRAKWGIVQNDALSYYEFLHFKRTKQDITDAIKVVLPLYNEDIHIFAKKNKNISFEKGSTLKVGIPSKVSGSKITARMIEKAYGITFQYRYINYQTGLSYLKKDKLDIYIDVISLPAKKYENIRGIKLVQLPQNDNMNKKYIASRITNKDYKWQEKSVSGYQVPSVIVTNRVEKKYNQTVGVFLKILLKNYSNLIKNGHYKWNEAYNNRFNAMNNMHPVSLKILQKN